MTYDPPSSEVTQFIVAPKSVTGGGVPSSHALAELLRLGPSRHIAVVGIVGPQESPRRLLIRGSRAQVAKLQEEFANELVFEEDRPLGLA
jgi:hypothetical protein